MRVEPGVHPLQVPEAAHEQRAGDQQNDGHRALGDDERTPYARVFAGCAGAPGAFEELRDGGIRGLHRRRKTEGQRRHD